MLTPPELRLRLNAFPRVPLAHLPTPLESMPRLGPTLGLPRLHVKRDDQTGLAFGGNKARKLEPILADVRAQGAESMVTWAGVQSNWCRQVAAGAARLGIRSVLVLLQKPGTPVEDVGNLLLDRILGAEVRVVVPDGEQGFLELRDVEDLVLPVVEEEADAGRKAYLAPVGGSLMEGSLSRPLGALAYTGAFLELFEQARERGFRPGSVVLATGSAGTQAGLLAGAKLLSPTTRVVGISVAAGAPSVSAHVADLARAVLEELGADPEVSEEEVIVLDEYLGEGYGVLNDTVADAIRIVARSEGLLLDPVYTGKAMAALVDLATRGFFGAEEEVVFLHTGGTPALFPYGKEILEAAGRQTSRRAGDN